MELEVGTSSTQMSASQILERLTRELIPTILRRFRARDRRSHTQVGLDQILQKARIGFLQV